MIATFFLSGIAFITFTLAGLLFLKFWRASGDLLFRNLCVAFWILSLERLFGLIFYLIEPNDEVQNNNRIWLYLFRLVAFIIILVAVIRKNRSADLR